MANDAQFGAVPVVGSSVLGATADTSYTAPTHTVTLLGGQGPRQVTDGVTAAFNSGDIGRPISGSGIPVGTVISAFASATSVTISQPATASASSVTLTLGGGFGTIVDEIDLYGTGTTVAGVVQTYLYDGTTYHAAPSFVVTVVTPSTTVAPFTASGSYVNLRLPPGWTLVATSFVASQLVNVVASGSNL